MLNFLLELPKYYFCANSVSSADSAGEKKYHSSPIANNNFYNSCFGLPFANFCINLKMAAFNDAELLDMLAGSDSAAFSYLYKAHFNMIRNLVEKNSGTYDDASDIFQETLIIIFEKVRDKKLHISCSLKTFIYSIARNQWLKKLNSRKKNVQLKNFEDFIRVEESETEFKQEVDLKNLFAEIGEACRKLLILFYYKKRSMEEISLELNYSNSDTAKNQKYKCIQRLKKLVAEKK